MLRPGLLLAAALTTALTTSPAAAEVVVGAELDAGFMFADGLATSVLGGPELALSVGYSPDLFPLIVVPELRAGYGYAFGSGGTTNQGDGTSFHTLRGLGGVRLGYAGPVEPTLSLHVGYGLQLGDDHDASITTHGVAFDAILGVDWRIDRTYTVGPRLGYAGLVEPGDSGRTAHWATIGVAAGFWL